MGNTRQTFEKPRAQRGVASMRAITVLLLVIFIVILLMGCAPGLGPSGAGVATTSPSLDGRSTGASEPSSLPGATSDSASHLPQPGLPSASSSVAPTGSANGYDIAHPITITALPFSYEANSRGAPAPVGDGDCESSEFGDHAVWFSFTALSDGYLGAWVSETLGYRELWAFEVLGRVDSLRYLDCSVMSYTTDLRVPVAAGSTYLIRVTDFPHQGTGRRGGPFTFEAEVAPPIPEISVTIDALGVALGDAGAANFSGSVRCSPRMYVDLDSIELRQGIDVVGSEYIETVQCRRAREPWFAEVYPADPEHPFTAGPASAEVLVRACSGDELGGPYYCKEVTAESTVTLRRIDDEPPASSLPTVLPSGPMADPSITLPSDVPTL